MSDPAKSIRIGTLVPGNMQAGDYIRQIRDLGFESFAINFWRTAEGIDFKKLAADVKAAIGDADIVVSALGIYGNPLGDQAEDEPTRKAWMNLIQHAHLFGPACNVICGFAGRVRGQAIPDSLKRYRKVFTPIAKRAADKGLRIAFENCEMGGTWQTGDWNIAHNPQAWELMFNEVDGDNIGLEWEPCHQMTKLLDPIPQLRKWVHKIFHIHGKDATIDWDVIREYGIGGSHKWVHHRTPGFGDSNWADIITILRMRGFQGAIDIEGWHDPVYKGELEMTGQVHALEYLKRCRGGQFIPNPK